MNDNNFPEIIDHDVSKPRLTVAFYKGDIISTFIRQSDNKNIAVIAFPKNSVYAGYVWYYPYDWIRSNDNAPKNDKAISFNPDKRWVRILAENDITIVKSTLDSESKKWIKESEIKIKPEELKEAMKRPFKLAEDQKGEIYE